MKQSKKAEKAKRLIRRYVNAQINDSWKGGGDPADYPYIEKELKDAKKALWKFLETI